MTSGDTVQNEYLKVKVPEGWEQIGRLNIMIRNKSTKAQYNILVNEGKTVEKVKEEYKLQFDIIKKSDKIKE